jgi:hypothetical protein
MTMTSSHWVALAPAPPALEPDGGLVAIVTLKGGADNATPVYLGPAGIPASFYKGHLK